MIPNLAREHFEAIELGAQTLPSLTWLARDGTNLFAGKIDCWWGPGELPGHHRLRHT